MRAVSAGQIIRRDEYLFRREFGRPIEIDRIACFVGRERDDLFHFGAQSRENNVLCAIDIGLDAFHWIIFGDRNMLHRRRVNYNIDVALGNFEPAAIAHVANKKANAGIRDFLGHLGLFEFVAREDDDLARIEILQKPPRDPLAERPGPARDEHDFIFDFLGGLLEKTHF
jgi:hypothetical protein